MKFPRSFLLLGCCVAFGMEIAFQTTELVAQTLPLADTLTSLITPEGQTLLLQSEAQVDYLPLMSHFTTQKNGTFCGVASIVMVLNALMVEDPLAPKWNRGYFTQDNIFSAQTEAVIPRRTIARQGMTLAELAGLFESYSVTATVHHGADLTLDEFRSHLANNLAEPDNFVVVNYLGRAIAQGSGGHISPLAAYDEDTDQFLILDVSRHKYPPVWVSAEQLWQATNTLDLVSGKTRGVVLVSPVVSDK